jgi:hypothetical protein
MKRGEYMLNYQRVKVFLMHVFLGVIRIGSGLMLVRKKRTTGMITSE